MSAPTLKPGTRLPNGTFAPGNDQRMEKNGHWKGDACTPDAARNRITRHLKVEGPCALCPDPACDRHHKDGDPYNNAPENIALLCRRCHMAIDGRLTTIAKMDAWRNRRERKAGGK